MILFVRFFLLTILSLSWTVVLSADVIDNFTIGGTDCSPDGLCTSVPGATTITFNGLAGTTSPYSAGAAIYTWTGESPFVNGTLSGQYAAPPDDDSTYLTVGSGAGRPSIVNIQFSTLMSYFGFYMGSPDTYNSVTFRFSNSGETQTFSGAQLLNPPDGNQAMGNYLNFFSSTGFDQVQLISTSAAFETDNHAYAPVPEPGPLVLLGSGLILVAAGVRRFSARPPA